MRRLARHVPGGFALAGAVALLAEHEVLENTLQVWRLLVPCAALGGLLGGLAAWRLTKLPSLAMPEVRRGLAVWLMLGGACFACFAASAVNRAGIPPASDTVRADVRARCVQEVNGGARFNVYFAWKGGVEEIAVRDDVWSRIATGPEAIELSVRTGRLGFTIVDGLRPFRAGGSTERLPCYAVDP